MHHCTEENVDESSGKDGKGCQKRGRKTNEPQRSNQRPLTLEIQTVLPHYGGTDVSSDWPPIQPRRLLWTKPGVVVSVGMVRKSAQGILRKVKAPASLATNRVLVKGAVGRRLSDERICRGVG